MPDKAKKEASYRPSAYYWRRDIRAVENVRALAGYIRDLGEEIATHDAALVRLGVMPKVDRELTETNPTTRATRAGMQREALRLVLALEDRKAEIRALGKIPPKSRLSPSEAKEKPHLLR